MPPKKKITRQTKIKDLLPRVVFKLRSELDIKEGWKQVACLICDAEDNEIFTTSDILNFELEFQKSRSPTDAMLRSWCHRNPTVLDLLIVLVKAERFDLLRAFLVVFMKEMTQEQFDAQATEGWEDYLRSDTTVYKPSRDVVAGEGRGDHGPAEPKPVDKLPSNVPRFAFSLLQKVSDDFASRPVSEGGRLLGTGGFGHVFLGLMPYATHTSKVAIKRLKGKEGAEKQFTQEIEVLSKLIHPNLLSLLGVSDDGPQRCLVYEYMAHGSLEDSLHRSSGRVVLSTTHRCSCAQGVAQALNYLHTHYKVAFIHRDIKSANILLDQNFTAKVGDCGLAHLGPSDPMKTYTRTNVIIGTTAYMPPEYMEEGEISEKFDAFSFGVVLMEMLTGLQPFDEDRQVKTLSRHVRQCLRLKGDRGALRDLLDPSVEWVFEHAARVYALAEGLTKPDKAERVLISEALPEILRWPEKW